MSSIIEQRYQAEMAKLSPQQRIERSCAMFEWTREMLARQIVDERGPMSAERLKWEVALRQYGAEPQARSIIERVLADVSH